MISIKVPSKKEEFLDEISTRLDKISRNIKNHLKLSGANDCNISILSCAIKCVADDLDDEFKNN